MARYLLSERSFIDNRLREAGETVEVADDFVPGPHMDPARDEKGREDKAARAAKDKAGEIVAPGHSKFIGNMIEHNMGSGEAGGRVEAASVPFVSVDTRGDIRSMTATDPALKE